MPFFTATPINAPRTVPIEPKIGSNRIFFKATDKPKPKTQPQDIPIIKNIVGYLLAVGDNTPDAFAMFVATMIAYVGFNATVEHVIKKIETQKLTLMLTGIYLTIFNILFVIIN